MYRQGMRFVMVVLWVFGVAGVALGLFSTFLAARTAVGEIEGLIAILIGVAGLAGAAVLEAILRLTEHVERGNAEAALARRGGLAVE